MSKLSSSAKLIKDDEIHPSGSNEMRFTNTEEIRRDHHLFDERDMKKNILGCITISIKKVLCITLY